MGLQIIGGSNSVPAQVTKEGLLYTFATNIDVPKHINQFYEESYIVMNTITPSASSDIFYVRNEKEDNLFINAIELYSDTDEIIEIYKNPTGEPSNGSNISPVNCNFNSNKQAVGTFYSGNDISGLSGGIKRNKIRLQAGKQVRYEMLNWTILPRNTSLSFHVINGGSGGELDFWIQFAYFVSVA